jgi:hypothetical protein
MTQLSGEKKHELLNRRLQSFASQLSLEADEPVLAAMIIVQWNADTSSGVTMVPLPKAETMKIVNTMAAAVSVCAERLLAKIKGSK